MTKRQTHISFFSIIILALMFVGMQAFIPGDALAQDEEDPGYSESSGPHNFYPLSPCRIADSRASWAQGVYRGPFFVGQTICYSNYSNSGTPSDIPQQGGNQFGCPSHDGFDPGGFHVNITAVPNSGAGHIRIYPANRGRPNASILNWDWWVGNIANAASVDSYESSANNEFCIYIGGTGGWTHVIMDRMGYYD